jgi:hypothetical protein
VIFIPATEILRWTSTFVSIGVKFVLAAYFFHKYRQKKMGVPLVWGAGFLFFGLSQVPILVMRYFKDPNTNMGFALLGAFLAALSLALIYYGSSLIYFKKGSFMREKLSIILFSIMGGVTLLFPIFMTSQEVLRRIFMVVATGFIFPVLFLVSVVFFVIWMRLEPDNPRKPNILLVSFGWFTYSIVNGVGSFSVGRSFEWVFYVLATIAFLILLYGMILGKATNPENTH